MKLCIQCNEKPARVHAMSRIVGDYCSRYCAHVAWKARFREQTGYAYHKEHSQRRRDAAREAAANE